ncbi:hypothetical protein D3C75_777070 [compost metagenome]
MLDGHRQISLPGVHSDIGGGYLPNGRERLWVTEPQRISVAANQLPSFHPQWTQLQAQAIALRDSGLAGDGGLEVKAWPIPSVPRGKAENKLDDYWLVIVLNRPVRGELALIALRLMRELGVRHGVPFDVISEEDQRLRLPDELQPIAEQIMEQALAGNEVRLGPAEECLLRSRYIHQSAHWTPRAGLLINKPAPNKKRNVYPNQPQKGYPQ